MQPLPAPDLASLLRHGTGDAALIVKAGRAERGLEAFGGDVLTWFHRASAKKKLPVAWYTNGIVINGNFRILKWRYCTI